MIVRPFRMECTDKEQVCKVLEEAAETFAAWQDFDAFTREMPYVMRASDDLGKEIADTITACVNLAERFGIDLQGALDKVELKNRGRGRYEYGS